MIVDLCNLRLTVFCCCQIQAIHEARIAVEAAVRAEALILRSMPHHSLSCPQATLTAACLQDLKTATANLESMAQVSTTIFACKYSF